MIVRDAEFESVKNERFWDVKKVAVSPSRPMICYALRFYSRVLAFTSLYQSL
jgi:hypothetical protein